MTLELAQVPVLSVGDVDKGAVDFSPYLDSGETITGTPTVADNDSTGHLTISGVAANASALTILGRTVAIGNAVQFTVSGQHAGTTYNLLVTAVTTASRTKKVIAKFRTAS